MSAADTSKNAVAQPARFLRAAMVDFQQTNFGDTHTGILPRKLQERWKTGYNQSNK